MMLNLRFGYGKDIKKSKVIDGMFRFNFDPVWFGDPFVKAIVNGIDKSDVLGERVILSPVLGQISPSELSCGAKMVLLSLYYPEHEYDGSACGDNCIKWFLEVARRHDIHLSYAHLPSYPDKFELMLVNTGKILTSALELCLAYIDLNNNDGTYRMVV